MFATDFTQVLSPVFVFGERVVTMSAETELLRSLPEFDSMAVGSILSALEEPYGIAIEDDDINAEIFTTVYTLIQFIAAKTAA
jgi:acyl carrier protein